MANLPLRVIGNRILIRPDRDRHAPELTEGGVYAARSLAAAVTGEDATTSLSRGTVVAVGQARHWLADEALTLAEKLSSTAARWSDTELLTDAAGLLRQLVAREPAVTLGDDVLFGADTGQEITIADETFLITTEDDLLAVVNGQPSQEPHD